MPNAPSSPQDRIVEYEMLVLRAEQEAREAEEQADAADEEARAYRETLYALESQPLAVAPGPEPWWQSLVSRVACLGGNRRQAKA